MSLPITVIIPAKNEALNIRKAIDSVRWAEKVYVVDSHSKDGTVEIAESMGTEVVQFDYDGGWPKKKNWAIRNLDIATEWILILDADERVTDALRDEMAEAIQNPDIVGYYLRWKFIFLGKWMKRSWNHGWMLRLFRKGAGEYEDLGMRDEGGWDNEVHENIVVHGKTGTLENHLIHDTNQDLSYWIRKQNEFSDWNAKRRLNQLEEALPPMQDLLSNDPVKRRKFLKALYIRMPGKPMLMFVYLYIIKRGFLDGRASLFFCALRAMHELNIQAKIFEKQNLTGEH